MRKKCYKYRYLEFFWSLFSRIWTEYGEVLFISLYSVQMRENTDQKNYGYFSRRVSHALQCFFATYLYVYLNIYFLDDKMYILNFSIIIQILHLLFIYLSDSDSMGLACFYYQSFIMSKDIFRTFSNIQDETFYKNSSIISTLIPKTKN